LGPASIGPSRCEGMMRWKSHCATRSAHRRTSSRRRGNASTCRMGGTNSGFAHSAEAERYKSKHLKTNFEARKFTFQVQGFGNQALSSYGSTAFNLYRAPPRTLASTTGPT
jgi:hypothetical protein